MDMETTAAPVSGALRAALDLMGAADFKSYLSATRELSEHMEAEKAKELLFPRAVLFSVNDGDGLRTQLRLLADFWRELLKKSELPVEHKELKLPDRSRTKNGDRMTDRDQMLESIDEEDLLSAREERLLCLDVSRWIDRMEGEDFRTLLSRLRDHRTEQLTAFRIPAVDELTLRRVREAIAWFFSVDVVYTPPYAIEDYVAYGLAQMKQMEIEPDAAAEAWFRAELTAERQDSGFWGFHTVDRLIDDMDYSALRSRCGKPEEPEKTD